jgi:hypothetical protein
LCHVALDRWVEGRAPVSFLVARRGVAAALAVAGGALLLYGNLAGSGLELPYYDQVKRSVAEAAVLWVPVDYLGLVPVTLALSVVLATFGGVVVIVGGAFFHRGNFRTGRLCVNIGAGTGLLGLTIILALAQVANEMDRVEAWLLGPPGLALLCIVLAQWEGRRRRKEEAGDYWKGAKPPPLVPMPQTSLPAHPPTSAAQLAAEHAPPQAARFRVVRRGPPPQR